MAYNEQKARRLFRQEYQGGKNFMTPSTWEFGMIRSEIAYELSYGSGMFGNSYMFGITILFIGPDGKVTRGDSAGRDVNQCLSGNNLSALAEEAHRYLHKISMGEPVS